jgi:hypothetical protein
MPAALLQLLQEGCTPEIVNVTLLHERSWLAHTSSIFFSTPFSLVEYGMSSSLSPHRSQLIDYELHSPHIVAFS